MPTSVASNRREVIQEFLTSASIEALNRELINRDIPADRIVAIHHLAGLRVSGGGNQFRVLHRVDRGDL